MAIPISSPFTSVPANESIPLWRGRVHLAIDAARTRGAGSIALELSPEPEVAWEQRSTDAVPKVLNADVGRLVPWGLGRPAGYQRTDLQTVLTPAGAMFESRGLLPAGIEIGPRHPISRLVFHVVNFPGYVGTPLELQGTVWGGRTVFRWSGWTAELDQVRDERSIRKGLRSTYGYALTHVGRLSRSDGTQFSVGEGLRCIDALHYLLGFVRGGWCGPALLSGRDGADRDVWQYWSVMLVDSAKPRPSIFVFDDPEIFARLAPGFMRRANGTAWGESYRRAVALYVAANRGVPIEIGITLAQSALELLAWSTYVRSGRVSPDDFKGWPAATQIRQLLERAKIPTSIPASLAALSGLSGVSAPNDGPETVAYVRNRIVHPPRTKAPRKLSSPELVATWRLMLRYTELVILRLAGYSGEIRSRVDDQVEPVPWK